MEYGPLTILDLYEFMLINMNGKCGLNGPDDIKNFIVSHASYDYIYISRSDSGKIRGALFAWPMNLKDLTDDYDGKWREDEVGGDLLYLNLIVIDSGMSRQQRLDIIRNMKEIVVEKYGDSIKYVSFHRIKYGDRYKVMHFNACDSEIADGKD